MLEYRIPIAQAVSGTITAVCFLIALIVITTRPAGRSRVFGLFGLLLVFLSTVVYAFNASVAGAYGTGTMVYVVGWLSAAAMAAGGLVLLALAVTRARRAGPARGGS